MNICIKSDARGVSVIPTQARRGFHTPPYCLRQQGPTRRTLAYETTDTPLDKR